MNIPWDQFRWYASFHDEGHHPHVHMVCYSADGKSGFLNKEGIAKIKSGMAKEIFRQELTEIYRQQTQHRDTLVQEAAETMARLIHQMRSGALENERIEQLMAELGRRLNRTTGKKQYGYLKAPLKSIVDEIADELEKDSRVAAAYDLWYQLREEVLRTYKNDLPERLPLSRQKEFKRIKNIVIEEAVKLDRESAVLSPGDEVDEPVSEDVDPAEQEPPEAQDEVPPTVRWSKRYKEARRLLTWDGDTPPDFERARALLLEEAQAGNALAMYALGRLYRDGGPIKPDAVQAVIWFAQAAEQGHEYAMYAMGKLDLEVGNTPAALRWFHLAAERGNQYAQYALGKLYLLGRDIPQDKDAAVHWFTLSAEQGNEYAQYFLDHINDTKLDSLLTSATRLLHHMGRIFRDETPPPSGGVSFVESKLRRKIREKKIAMGHKPDDHEDQPVMSY